MIRLPRVSCSFGVVHELLLHGLQHAGAGEARDRCQPAERQREGRHQDVLELPCRTGRNATSAGCRPDRDRSDDRAARGLPGNGRATAASRAPWRRSICRMIANQNEAMASPATVSTRMTWSNSELCQTAAMVADRNADDSRKQQRDESQLDGGRQPPGDVAERPAGWR